MYERFSSCLVCVLLVDRKLKSVLSSCQLARSSISLAISMALFRGLTVLIINWLLNAPKAQQIHSHRSKPKRQFASPYFSIT